MVWVRFDGNQKGSLQRSKLNLGESESGEQGGLQD